MSLLETRPILDLHPPTDGERRYLNRELTWLSFNGRVLRLAEDPTIPLLERVKFIAIFASNLDEFFQVRVAGVMEQASASSMALPPDGMTPAEQLVAIHTHAASLVTRHTELLQELLPMLAEHGITLPRWHELTDDERTHLVDQFDRRIFPVLTPLAVDPSHPFPYISNLSLNLAVEVRDRISNESRFARIKVPTNLPRFIKLPDADRFVPLEQVIAANLDRLFPGLDVVDHHVFRVTRNADMDVEQDEADDLLQAIEDELTRRRFGKVVRLEVEPSMPDETRALLQRELSIADEAVEVSEGPLDLSGLFAVGALDRKELLFETFTPTVPPRLAAATGDSDIFAEMARGDILLHHPYDSFNASVTRFVNDAARDPQVLAIKITLYRTSGPGSPLVRALLKAAEEGKQVVALIELKARFDEEANIEWARVLEEAGVHVAYGVIGLKTHTKIALVVRDEGDTLRRYAHIGTGNYNDKTATLYEDIGILTADHELGADLSDLFNVLTGYSRQQDYRRLLVAPQGLSQRLVELIAEQAELGPKGRITMKMNALADEEMIESLYAASAAGVPIDLIVRGICCLRAGVPGLSETIRVRSIVGRYLEHSRVYRFGPDGGERIHLLGSADLMARNLHRRVEAVTQVTDPENVARLDEVLDVLLSDDRLAWHQRPDGSWGRPRPTDDGIGSESHARLQSLAMDRARPRRTGPIPVADAAERVRAAGGVVLRDRGAGTEVLVVHRPRYDDWSLPKGKLDHAESWEDAALREVHEETGVAVELGTELQRINYTDRKGRPKTVRWWTMRATEGHPEHRGIDREVDEARWVHVAEARSLLSYDTDRQLVREALQSVEVHVEVDVDVDVDASLLLDDHAER